MNRHKSSRQNQAVQRHQDFLRSFFINDVKPNSIVEINGWKLIFYVNPNNKFQWHIKEERIDETKK